MTIRAQDLQTESDVEQKVLYPLLIGARPQGLGFAPPEILTKLNIRRLEIGKGPSKKLHFPDYIVVLAGFPVMVIEAKAPGEDLDEALEEARLYAAKLNSLFPTGVNPCLRVVASDGLNLVSSPADTTQADHRITLDRM